MESGQGAIHLRKLIKKKGYISIATFMDEIIRHYYENEHVIGLKGDFITSPEISQLFGEIIGIWCMMQWQKMGSPKQFIVIELGPGRGTLINDMLRSTSNFKDFHKAIEVHLIETSTRLVQTQKQTLTNWSKIKFIWHNNLSTVPSLPTLLIANEFFDALPTNQYVKVKKEWYENVVTTLTQDGELCFSSLPVMAKINDLLNNEYPNAGHRAVVEMSPDSIEVVKKICRMLSVNKGYALIIDYGYFVNPTTRTEFGPTLQAIKNHRYHPVLHDIGRADITAHVDFYALKQAIIDSEFTNVNVTTQKVFLMTYGILERANILINKAINEEQKNYMLSGLNRLVAHNKMGNLFKVLEFSR